MFQYILPFMDELDIDFHEIDYNIGHPVNILENSNMILTVFDDNFAQDQSNNANSHRGGCSTNKRKRK